MPGALIVTATAPERWHFLRAGAAHPRARAARHRRPQRGDAAGRRRARRPLPRRRRPIPASPSPRTSATTVCTHPRCGHAQAAARASRRCSASRFGIESAGCQVEADERHRALAADFDQLEPGGASSATPGRTITEADLVSFAALTGDWHPQHADAEWAAASALRRPRRARDAASSPTRSAWSRSTPSASSPCAGSSRSLQAPGADRRHDPRRGPRSRTQTARSTAAIGLVDASPGRSSAEREPHGGADAELQRESGAARPEAEPRGAAAARRGGICAPSSDTEAAALILEGKRILVTGVVNRRSIAFAIAERAQRARAPRCC